LTYWEDYTIIKARTYIFIQPRSLSKELNSLMSKIIQCEICRYDNPAEHFFCGHCGNGLQAVNTESLMSAAIEGERKQVTIIFADISGFTALNDAANSPAEVEQVIRLINLCLQELSEAIYEFDGYIDKYIGDAIMAIFGAPKAHEDDPERALRAALAMQERLKQFNENPPMPLPEELGIHMGINTGTVIAGMVGTDRKRSYTVMGDAVNVASRLEGVSERGEIIISEATYALTNRLFAFTERDAVKLKGKRDPLRIYQLNAARDLSQTQRGLTGMEAPLIGREYEMQNLLKHYQKLYQGQGSIITVTGDAGLGKSRLIVDFKKQVNHHLHNGIAPLWLFGRGLSYRQTFTNRLLVDILHGYLKLPENPDDTLVKLRLEAMGDELFGPRKNQIIPYLATLLGLKLDDETAAQMPLNDPKVLQQRTYLAVGKWIETLTQQQPVIMVFEDLHWADPSSINLIEYLFSLTRHTPLLILAVTRPDRESNFWNIKIQSARDYADHFTELTLWPLTDDESRQLLKFLLKIEEMPPHTEQLLLNRAEGNPLFLEEVLRSLIEEGVIQRANGYWGITRTITEIDIPTTLQGVLTARIDRLAEPVKRVLQIAAVIGRVFPRFVLAPIVNDPEILEKALNELELAELIKVRTPEPEPEYMFKHFLTHETAYHSLLYQQRVIIHKQIGDYMSRLYWQLGEEFAAIVAEHYLKSESRPRALRYLHRAGDAAAQSFANQKALEFYTRALSVAEEIGDEADQSTVLGIFEGRAKALAQLGEPQKAINDYEAVLSLARRLDNNSAQLRALNGVGSLYASHYDFSRASQFFREALEVARRIGDERGVADTLNQLGNFYYNMGELESATQCYREANEISITLSDELRRIEAEDGLAKIMLEQGEIAASVARYQEIVAVRRRLGYRSGLVNSLATVQMAHTFLGHYSAADEIAAEIVDLQQKSGDLYFIPFIKYYQALTRLYRGELGEAGTVLNEGVQLAEHQKHKAFHVIGQIWRAYYYLTVGMNGQGMAEAEQSLAMAQELGSSLYAMRARFMVGAAHRHLKQTDEAIKILKQVHTTAQQMGFAPDEVMILYQLIRAYIKENAWDIITPLVARLLAMAKASEMQEYVIRGQWLKSLLDIHREQYEDALNTLIEASNLAEQTDSRLSNYLIQIQKSYVYHLSGNGPASRDAMAYARKIQKRLLESLPNEVSREAFLNTLHAHHLQEMADVYTQERVKLETLPGESA
jgi:class 3 adenylate cyclase/tetratricopeptide (TPR) repeat protein